MMTRQSNYLEENGVINLDIYKLVDFTIVEHGQMMSGILLNSRIVH